MVANGSKLQTWHHRAEQLAEEGADIITAGFPCQDISFAGKGAGLAGARSGLVWPLMRTIRLVRPRAALLENVAALLGRGLGSILGHLAEVGYDTEWHCISAASVGAPHQRDRVWIIAADADRSAAAASRSDGGAGQMADANVSGLAFRQGQSRDVGEEFTPALGNGWWAIEPDVGRVVARLSSWLDGGRVENADACKGSTREILQVLRDGDGTQALQWTAGGLVGVPAAEALFAAVREYQGAPKPLGNVSLARTASSQIALRSLWFDGSIACPSCRREAGEQRARKHPDAMRVVSQLLACDCRSAWLDRAGSTGTLRRVDRLRCLGNAVVPHIPEMLASILKQTAA